MKTQKLYRKPTSQDAYSPHPYPARILATLRRNEGLDEYYPMYRTAPPGLEDYLGHSLEEVSLALRLDALSVVGRYDGVFFKNSSKPHALTTKRRTIRERSEDLITVRLYRRDLIALLDNPHTDDAVYLCEGEMDLKALVGKIPINAMTILHTERINSYYMKYSTSDTHKYALWVESQAVMNEDRRTTTVNKNGVIVPGKPSLPDMAVYTSLYDALGFGPYNRPLVDGSTRYEAAKTKFPESFSHLGIGKHLTAVELTEGVQNMYSDMETLPKRFRELERFMEALHRRYQLPLMTSYRSGLWFPTDSRGDSIEIAGQDFYRHSPQCPKIYHRGILHALIHGRDAALREIMLKEGNHATLLETLAKHGILDEINNPGFQVVINKYLIEGNSK